MMKNKKSVMAAIVAGLVMSQSELSVAESLALEEIMVTAQKREENLQDVGVSVTAFSGDQMKALNFASAADVTAQAPNVQSRAVFGTRGFFTLLTVRGVGQTDFNDATESPVTAYVDEFYLINPGQIDFLLMDFKSTEVLRGPQGTIFGRNATGGAISYNTNRPGDEFGAELELDIGNFEKRGGEGFINVPLGDRAAFRLSASVEKHDHIIENAYPGNDDLREGDFQAVRGQLRLDPSDNLTMLFKVEHGKAEGNLVGRQLLTTAAEDGGVVAAPSDWFGYNEEDAGLGSDEKTSQNGYNFSENKISSASIRVEWETDAFTLTSVTGFMDHDKDNWEDCDRTPTTWCSTQYLFESEHFSQEVRLNGSTDSLDWTFGVNYLEQDSQSDQEAGLLMGDAAPLAFDPGIGGLIFDVDWQQDLASYAAFGQVEYQFLDEWTGIVGLRVTRDEKDFEQTKVDYLSDTTVANPQPGDWGTFNNVLTLAALDFTKNGDGGSLTELHKTSVTGTLQINWSPSEDLLFYGSYRRGVKSGGFNNGFINIGPVDTVPYDEEVLHAYELGYKLSFSGGLGRLNGAFFYYDYKDFQASFFEDIGLTVTNTDATVYGAEIELVASPVDGLDVWLGMSLLDTEAEDITNLGVTEDREMGGAPDFTANGVIRYSWEAMGGTMAAQLSATYTDERSNDVLNNPVLRLDDYTKADANLNFTSSDDRWSVTLYVNNLTDEEVEFSKFELSALGNTGTRTFLMPRQYGIKLGYNWY